MIVFEMVGDNIGPCAACATLTHDGLHTEKSHQLFGFVQVNGVAPSYWLVVSLSVMLINWWFHVVSPEFFPIQLVVSPNFGNFP